MISASDLILRSSPDRWDGSSAWWPVFPLLWLVVVGAAITTFVLVGRLNRAQAGGRAGETRLAERFASGEITEDEYRHRLSILKERP